MTPAKDTISLPESPIPGEHHSGPGIVPLRYGHMDEDGFHPVWRTGFPDQWSI